MKQEEGRNYGCLDRFDFYGDNYSVSNQVTQVFSLALKGSLQAHQGDILRQAFKNKMYLFMEVFLGVPSNAGFQIQGWGLQVRFTSLAYSDGPDKPVSSLRQLPAASRAPWLHGFLDLF